MKILKIILFFRLCNGGELFERIKTSQAYSEKEVAEYMK